MKSLVGDRTGGMNCEFVAGGLYGIKIGVNLTETADILNFLAAFCIKVSVD